MKKLLFFLATAVMLIALLTACVEDPKENRQDTTESITTEDASPSGPSGGNPTESEPAPADTTDTDGFQTNDDGSIDLPTVPLGAESLI